MAADGGRRRPDGAGKETASLLSPGLAALVLAAWAIGLTAISAKVSLSREVA